ncbi:MAG: heme-copper oxidase subunit III [Dehalococcoidia bacterium]|nr:heme-copper oxidase subunit III [Dehalococcoidia bacterium]
MAAHGAVQHRQGLSNGMLGFILFVASEVMFFGGLFAAYFIARADAPSWPPTELLTEEQLAAGVELHLEWVLPTIATVLLVLSSVTIQIGVMQIQRGNRTALMWWLFVSIVLGLIFLAMQMYDYAQLPFRADDTIFGTTFYTLTGFHGAHVAGGVIFMLVVLVRSAGGQFDAGNHEAVEACSFYWHFVDVVWLALFTTLYIVGPRS